MEFEIELRIESLKIEIENSGYKLAKKINKYIQRRALNQELDLQRCNYENNPNSLFDETKIGFMPFTKNQSLQPSKNIEELVQNVCKILKP